MPGGREGREKPGGRRRENQRKKGEGGRGTGRERRRGGREERGGSGGSGSPRPREERRRAGTGPARRERGSGREGGEWERAEEEAGTEEPARERAASEKCRPRRGGEARGGGREEGGDEGTRGRGERSLEAARRHGAARAGPGRGSLPAPARGPRRPARAQGPPASPAPARRPPGASSPRAPPAGCLPGPEPVRAGPAARSASRGAGGGEPGAEGRGVGEERTEDHTPGRTDGRRSPRRPDTGAKGRRARGRLEDAASRASLKPGRPPPTTLAPHFTLLGPGPIGLTPSLPHCDRPGRPCSRAEARDSGSRAASRWRRMGGGGQPRLPEERGEPHYAGLARDARLSASAASSSGDAPGLQSSALGDLPASNSLEPWGETVASVASSELPVPGGTPGQPQRPGRRICQADGNSEGVRCVRRARYPRLEPTAPALPLETGFTRQSRPDHREGQPSQGRATC